MAGVADPLYNAVRPMLAVSGGKLIALSTPFGRRGWFFEEWDGKNAWERVAIKAADCPRITEEFLAEELASIGSRWFRQEYGISFEDTTAALFAYEDLMAACSNDVRAEALPD